jgi:dTDP-4-dehydrorhamnose reductase
VSEQFLVIGGDSLVGSRLLKAFADSGRCAIGTSRRAEHGDLLQFNLKDDPAALLAGGPFTSSVICAGITNQDACRRDPLGTREVNVIQTLKLARTLASAGCFVIFLSTNLVFDGTSPSCKPDDTTNPRTEYGRQKAEVEDAILGGVPNAAIVRLTKVLHPQLSILKQWRNELRSGRTIAPFVDYFCSPISLGATVQALLQIATERRHGIWQISGERDVSYFHIASELARRLGRPESQVIEGTTRSILNWEHLPQHTTLDASRVATELHLALPSVSETVKRVINDES